MSTLVKILLLSCLCNHGKHNVMTVIIITHSVSTCLSETPSGDLVQLHGKNLQWKYSVILIQLYHQLGNEKSKGAKDMLRYIHTHTQIHRPEYIHDI